MNSAYYEYNEFSFLSSFSEHYFSLLIYHKGAAVVRMLEYIVGREDFRKGAHHLTKRYSFGNVHQDDLWETMSAVDQDSRLPEGTTIKDVMDSWTSSRQYKAWTRPAKRTKSCQRKFPPPGTCYAARVVQTQIVA